MAKPRSDKAKKWLFFVLGTLSLIMTYVGAALPGVPGIPFLLLSAYFYVRSSDRMYNWLLNHRWFGKMLREFQEKKTVPVGFKILVISQLWVSILVGQIWVIEQMWIRIVVTIAGLITSIVTWRWNNPSMQPRPKEPPTSPSALATPASEKHYSESDPKTHNDPVSPPPHKTTPDSADTP
ncbi:MAG: YbaN family protein [Bacteroidia bacterium]